MNSRLALLRRVCDDGRLFAMGAAASRPGYDAFEAMWTALPEDVQARIAALAAAESDALLKPSAAAPPPFPPVPVGVTLRLSQDAAQAALALVPRLQRKHYEFIPKQLTELEFWASFFSHTTAIVAAAYPAALEALDEPSWKGVDTRETNSFEAAWAKLGSEERRAVAGLAAKESDVLLSPCAEAPLAFPYLPLGIECFVDEKAATSALLAVDGLQAKHYSLVPRKLSEKAFWVNFFTHMTAATA